MSDWKQRIGESLRQWVRMCLLLLLCMVAVRPLFFLEVLARVGLEPALFFTVLSGSLFDLLLVSRILAYGLIPFVLLHVFFPKTAQGIFTGLIVLYAVISTLLAEYYCNLTMPLDHVVLVYTPEELKTTVFSSTTSLTFAQVFWFVLQVGVPVLCIWLWRKVKVGKWLTLGAVLIGLGLGLLVDYPQVLRSEKFYRGHYQFCLAVNQPSYSYVKITDYLRDDLHHHAFTEDAYYDGLLKEAVAGYHESHPEFDYDTPGYPFYRKVVETDVLGPFFEMTSDSLPPNLVFVIVEGLGRRLTGVPNPGLSFTPFIDSLAAEGLFWPNCLSTSERTFGVLPSVFASAPYGRYGFSTPLAPTPRHHSLLRDLRRNGYTSSFYYGGDLSFDRHDFFLKMNHVDYLFTPQMAVDDSAHYQLLVENNRWGLDDEQLVDIAIKRIAEDTLMRRPHLDIFLTLSTHEPFVIDGLEHYEEQVRDLVEHTPNLIEKERNNVLRNQNIFACYLYLDQSIRKLFQYYASRPDYANTVFVITGDHRMAPLPLGTSQRKYNVPLVVFSPLLKQRKTMEAVVSHLDIAPSFNAYLEANYDYQIDDHCHWLGTSFDTAADFRNTRKQAFMLNNRDVVDYLSGNYLVSNNTLVYIGKDLSEYPSDNPHFFDSLKRELDDFDLVSRFVVERDFLLPEDVRTQLYSCHLDFGRNTLGMFDKYQVRDSSFLRVKNDVEFFSLCSHIAIMPLYQDLLVEVSFDVRNADVARPLPLLEVRCGELINTHEMLTPSNGSLNTGQWEHFHYRVNMNVYGNADTEALMIYLFNKGQCEFCLDNLVINVEATRREE